MAFTGNNRGERAPPTLPSLMVPFRDSSEGLQKKEKSDMSPSPMTKLLANFFDDHHEEEPEVKIESFSHMPNMPMSNGPTSGDREGGSGTTSESLLMESTSEYFPIVISSSESFPIATSASEGPAMAPTSESLSMESASISMPKLESSWMGSTSNSLSVAPKSGLSSIASARNESSSIVALTSESLSVVSTTPESLSRVMESSLPTHVSTTLGLKGSAINETGRRSNIARFKTMMPARIPIPRSPYLTIPPGLSPAALLDSPVLLSTSQAEPSPTTGTFPLPRIGQSMRLETSDTTQKGSNEDSTNVPFSFKLVSNINKNPPSPLSKLGISQLQNTELQIGAQALSSLQPSVLAGTDSDQSIGQSVSFCDAPEAVSPPQLTLFSENVKVIESSMVSEPVIQSLPLANLLAIERPSEDGYNWRKYGQKQVKGSEFPRSYYKCTHPNCQVKKKLERSHDGHITEIIYKGEHNHPKPQSTRRSSVGPNGSSKEGLCVVSHNADGHDLKIEMSVSRGQMGSVSNGTGTPELSLGSTSDIEVEVEASKAENGDDDDEPDSKRRRDSFGEVPLNLPLRTSREPRVVVQTISEVDILDDGYRWRKYGQKIVKGNPHPRSYYKCTNIGCSVRKHVERSSTDRGAVITTYEGKHNHDVPAAKNRHHDNPTSLIGSSLTHPHANSAIIVSYADCNVIPSTVSLSLQGQYSSIEMMGGDRLKVDGSNVQIMPIELARDHQGISSSLVQASMGHLDSAMNRGSLQGSEDLGHRLMARPKEEKVEVSSSSWPSSFIKSSIIQQLSQGS